MAGYSTKCLLVVKKISKFFVQITSKQINISAEATIGCHGVRIVCRSELQAYAMGDSAQIVTIAVGFAKKYCKACKEQIIAVMSALEMQVFIYRLRYALSFCFFLWKTTNTNKRYRLCISLQNVEERTVG